MNRLNLWLTFSSLSVLLVTIERFSPTTKIILQPFNFLRVHEVVQMMLIILATTLIPFMIFKELTQNFTLLKKKNVFVWAILFIIGIYFYATGNGVHEVASYIFNTFCNTKQVQQGFCGSSFFNDYYFGNIVYFIGAYLMVIPLIFIERENPGPKFDRKNWIILIINAVVFAFAIFAYAAFDRVLVGLVYSVISTISVLYLLFSSKKKYNSLPYTSYAVITYTLGTIASLLVRFLR